MEHITISQAKKAASLVVRLLLITRNELAALAADNSELFRSMIHLANVSQVIRIKFNLAAAHQIIVNLYNFLLIAITTILEFVGLIVSQNVADQQMLTKQSKVFVRVKHLVPSKYV